jgi:hypothetical protein
VRRTVAAFLEEMHARFSRDFSETRGWRDRPGLADLAQFLSGDPMAGKRNGSN